MKCLKNLELGNENVRMSPDVSVSDAVVSSPYTQTSVHACYPRGYAPAAVVSQSTSSGLLQSCCRRRHRTEDRLRCLWTATTDI